MKLTGLVISMLLLVVLNVSSNLYADEPPEVKTTKSYWIDATTYSIIPELGIETYRNHSGGGFEPNSSLETGVHDKTHNLRIKATGRFSSQKVLVKVDVIEISDGERHRVEKLSRELDLTDLNAEVLEFAKDPDGRVYRVSLRSRVVETTVPQIFRAEEQGLDRWAFHGSTVIVNDFDYLGMLNMAGGSMAFFESPGFARVEFSLLPLTDSTDEGILRDGRITIRHDQDTVVIRDVRTGAADVPMKGAFKVFVRWKPPEKSKEQVRKELASTIHELKAQLKANDHVGTKAEIVRLEKLHESGRTRQLMYGTGPVLPNDIDRTPLTKEKQK